MHKPTNPKELTCCPLSINRQEWHDRIIIVIIIIIELNGMIGDLIPLIYYVPEGITLHHQEKRKRKKK